MGSQVGALGRGKKHSSTGRQFVKKLTSRKARRMGKRLLDDAPKRVTKGYDD
jgi:hypothetical protein